MSAGAADNAKHAPPSSPANIGGRPGVLRGGRARTVALTLVLLILGLGASSRWVGMPIGLRAVRQNDISPEQTALQSVVRHQVMDGVHEMLMHLMTDDITKLHSNDAIFQALKDRKYLYEVGKSPMFMVGGGSTRDGFDQYWKQYSHDIQKGKQLLDDALVKYSHILDAELMLAINGVLRDKFFLERFDFASYPTELGEGEYDSKHGDYDTGWGKLGLYYFNIVYSGDGKRDGKYDEFIDFIAHVQHLVAIINKREAILLFP